MKKRILVIFLVFALLFIPIIVEAKVISGWEPETRSSVDLQVALYAEYGYASPVNNYYDESSYIIEAGDSSNTNIFQSIQRDGSFGDSDKIMTYDSEEATN
ncbi:MAG: hypothetical protein ACOCQS_00795 [Bacillota bacterium]